MKSSTYHHCHVRINAEHWLRLRKLFPEYGQVRAVMNVALAEFLDRWEADIAQAKEHEEDNE